MTRTTKPVSTVGNHGIRTRMIRNAMGCNKFLPFEYLTFKSTDVLSCFCHPIDREQFESELRTSKESN
jgi:hypothetical protein